VSSFLSEKLLEIKREKNPINNRFDDFFNKKSRIPEAQGACGEEYEVDVGDWPCEGESLVLANFG